MDTEIIEILAAKRPILRSDLPETPFVASRLSQYATQVNLCPLPLICVTPCN